MRDLSLQEGLRGWHFTRMKCEAVKPMPEVSKK
jgi:hypothetical protein